jgi:hypothetical protein
MTCSHPDTQKKRIYEAISFNIKFTTLTNVLHTLALLSDVPELLLEIIGTFSDKGQCENDLNSAMRIFADMIPILQKMRNDCYP